MGKSLDKCFGCEYCVVKDYRHENMDYPDDPLVSVSVNMFYGDPMLQVDNTVEVLEGLEKRKHKGKVVLMTKGDFSKMPDRKFDLDLWYGFSTFGIDHKIDGGSIKQFEKNIAIAKKRKINCFIKFAPIMKGINDIDESIKNIAKHNLPVSYTGMDGGEINRAFVKKLRTKCNAYSKTTTLIADKNNIIKNK